jgi:hypothetical protein
MWDGEGRRVHHPDSDAHQQRREAASASAAEVRTWEGLGHRTSGSGYSCAATQLGWAASHQMSRTTLPTADALGHLRRRFTAAAEAAGSRQQQLPLLFYATGGERGTPTPYSGAGHSSGARQDPDLARTLFPPSHHEQRGGSTVSSAQVPVEHAREVRVLAVRPHISTPVRVRRHPSAAN